MITKISLTQYVWIQMKAQYVRIKWNEYKVYALRFAENCSKYQWLHHVEWVWFEPIYSWGSKLAVIDFLVITSLPLLWIQLAASCYRYVQKFEFLNICYATLLNPVSRFATVPATVNYFLKLYFYPKTFYNCIMVQNIMNSCK